ncbi:MAG TPA: choice-of-anchor U domain-containing protein [Candidatus Saccharimonadia bacterium]|nr:choice-of-anchor U domain-containing protein [Candidatus Saccharimonadia bacterium]
MIRPTFRRASTVSLMVLAVGLYMFGGVFFRPHTAAGASGNGRVAFAGQDNQSNMQIYTMNADGSDVQQLTNDTNYNIFPVWSPDGTKLAYMSTDFGDQTTQIFVMDADGSNKVDISNDDNTQNGEPTWSPDGSKIAYSSIPADYSTSYAIKTMSPDGSNKIILTNGTSDAFYPTWKPDGSQIAFSCIDSQQVAQICTMNPDGSNLQHVTSGTAVDYTSVAYSPSGTEFAYATYDTSNNDIINIAELGTMNTDGSNAHILNTADHSNVGNAHWSPDGTKLIYDSYDSSETAQRIYTINLDGSSETAISPNNQTSQVPSWQPIPTSDMDGDGILNSAEAAAPNNGDANGDGIGDKFQANVTSIVDPITTHYVSVQTSCASNTGVMAQALPVNYADTGFHYPAGLISFTSDCGSNGTTAQITQYFYGISALNTMVLRKYNTQAHTYATVPGTLVASATIGGQSATKISYQITDGGPFDQDGSANGTIVDPVGLAVPSVGTPNTGVGTPGLLPRILAAPSL